MSIAGLTLIMSGLRGRSIEDTLRALMEGRQLEGGPSLLPQTRSGGTDTGGIGAAVGASIVAGSAGQSVANTAASYAGPNGVPYVWGGHTPNGWDCSGFVSYVLIQNNVAIPREPHTLSAQFYVWKGAQTVPRSACAPGDLVCYVGHVAIALDNTRMVHAPGKGQRTKIAKIYNTPMPVIRRPRAYTNAATP